MRLRQGQSWENTGRAFLTVALLEPGVEGVSRELYRGWLFLIIIQRGPYFLGQSMQRGHISEGAGAPAKKWGQLNPFTPHPSHSISRTDAKHAASMLRRMLHFLIINLG